MPYTCSVCRKEILGKWLETDGAFFHPQCFTCDKCKIQLPGTFHNHAGLRVCDSCLPSRICGKCGKEILGEGIEADGILFHAECFSCDRCQALLTGPYHPLGGQRYCQSCASLAATPAQLHVAPGGQVDSSQPCGTSSIAGAHQNTAPAAAQNSSSAGAGQNTPTAAAPPKAAPKQTPYCTPAAVTKPAVSSSAPPVSLSSPDRTDADNSPPPATVTSSGQSPEGRQIRFASDTKTNEEVTGEAHRVYNMIDPEGTNDVSRLLFLQAMDIQEVNEYVCPEVDGDDALKHEHVFDVVCALFDRIADGRLRFGKQEFCTYFGEAAVKLRRKTMQLTGSRAMKRILIIGPGFGRELNPRQSKLVEQAGFNIHWCVNLPNPETPNFPIHQFLAQIKADIDLHRPDAVVAASKGGAYITGLWQAGFWLGPTVLLNAHPTLGRLPRGPVVLAHGANDEVYSWSRAELEQIMATGAPNRTLFYYTGNSGALPGGRLTRMGDMHNMESLMHYQTLPRLIDAALSNSGPELSFIQSWRDRITDGRLVGEQWLGYTPELLKRFWASSQQRGMDARKTFEVPFRSPEFEQVANIFRSQPREPPMYCGVDPGAWTNANILKIERVENGQQMDGNAKSNCEALRKAMEDQGMTFEPGVHTRWVFHGTDAVESVVSNPMQGFQPLAAGTRGSSVWGLGTYFARDAKYVSDGGFAPVNSHGISVMLMCLIMTGMSCLGDPGHKGVLPFRQKPHRYNSSVDSLSSPEIFIIQHPGAAYPAYVITFQKP